MRLTLGMACYDDALGVRSTLQQYRIFHADVMDQVELLVVDNHPESKHGEDVRNLCRQIANTGQACCYLTCSTVGTSPAREMVFREAAGEWVFCTDSHIELDSDPRHPPHVLRRLLDWIDKNGGCRDLITGPMVYDGLNTWNTHYNDVWNDGTWGQWGLGWQCSCGFHFCVRQRAPDKAAGEGGLGVTGDGRLGELGQCQYVPLMPPQTVVASCPQCSQVFPTLAWAGHEDALRKLGYKALAEDRDDPPFEIPASGLGLFGCRKDAWIPFPEDLRGWGGEEWCVHEMWRAAGRKCISLPFLRWVHRYGDAVKPADPRPVAGIARNYALWHAHVGIPTERFVEHYRGRLPEKDFAAIMANPKATSLPCAGCNDPTMDAQPQLVVKTSQAITDVHQQEKIGEFVERCTTVAFLDRNPGVPPCDMLVVNACRGGECFSALMVKHHLKVKHWIAVLGTSAHGYRGEDGGYGLIQAVGNFVHHEKQWFPVWLDEKGAGLIVLSRDSADEDQRCYLTPPGFGVGTEMMKLFKDEFGVEEKPNCQCRAKAQEMDMIGIHGVLAKKEEIIQFLKNGLKNFGWSEVLGSGWKLLTQNPKLAWTIGVKDPLRGCVDEAIRREERRMAEARRAV